MKNSETTFNLILAHLMQQEVASLIGSGKEPNRDRGFKIKMKGQES